MNSYEKLAELIFGDIHQTIDDLEKRYPERNLKEGSKVTRFAPSPTGFLHTGSLFTSMIAYKIAKDSGGIFYLRLEDTDTKREIKGSDLLLIEQLNKFGIKANEGYFGDKEIGIYGPYKQSDRRDIYRTVIKEMIVKNLAYPCFLSEEEINKIREEQSKNKENTGIYGKYAIYRDLDPEEAIRYINEGKPYVIRFKSKGNHLNKIKVKDEIRGELELTENDQDIVILKSDGLPTYHFAHVVDDHFMRTNLVTRGEEWLSSLPIHYELFRSLNFKLPKYAHLPVIMKMDNGVRRKLSKRKDNEASVEYFIKQGYEPYSLLVYLMTIANSNYEDYVVQTKDYNLDHFKFNLKKMSLDGALFDNDKLDYYGKEILGYMKKEEISSKSIAWAKQYDQKTYDLATNLKEKYVEILNIEREKKNPRKDYSKYSDIYENIKFFSTDEFDKIDGKSYSFNEKIDKNIIKNFLSDYLTNYVEFDEENKWYQNIKNYGLKYKFAVDSKEYKANPTLFTGNMNDLCEILRVVLTKRSVTPNLFSIFKILGKDEVKRRLELAINFIGE